MLPANRVLSIQQIALDLLAKYHVKSAPVDVQSIAESEGISVLRGQMSPDMSGALYREQGRTAMAINGGHAPARQRFTIAHEIGHHLLHPGEDLHLDRVLAFRRSGVPGDRKEAEANEFAANLLMPEPFLRELVNEFELFTLPDPMNRIALLASDFRVSQAAMTYRLINLRLLPNF